MLQNYSYDSLLGKFVSGIENYNHLVPSVGAVIALNGYPDAPTHELAAQMKDNILGDDKGWTVSSSIDQFKTFGTDIWESWDGKLHEYQSAASSAVNQVRDFRLIFSIPISMGLRDASRGAGRDFCSRITNHKMGFILCYGAYPFLLSYRTGLRDSTLCYTIEFISSCCTI